jgi:hypothetical protein
MNAWQIIRLALALTGMAFILVARGVHCFVHPEWTEMQSLYHLGLPYALAITMMFPYLLLDGPVRRRNPRQRPRRRP